MTELVIDDLREPGYRLTFTPQPNGELEVSSCRDSYDSRIVAIGPDDVVRILEWFRVWLISKEVARRNL
jgi:hypothetical protein